MAPISPREQQELDKLLSDIYRGIETLPDQTSQSSKSQELQFQRQQQQQQQQHYRNYKPQGSTLKREAGKRVGTPAPAKATGEAQSLASFVTHNSLASPTRGATKRRVRIVDRDFETELAAGDRASSAEEEAEEVDEEEEPDHLDGATRVEIYQTTWLDRQLGRKSKRSKELNERQVKEKAMIEELKRSLKNGAITLRQSFKGNKRNNKHKSDEQREERETKPKCEDRGGQTVVSGPYTSRQLRSPRIGRPNQMQQEYSRTLPSKSKKQEHQFLQSHYRGGRVAQFSQQPIERSATLSHRTHQTGLAPLEQQHQHQHQQQGHGQQTASTTNSTSYNPIMTNTPLGCGPQWRATQNNQLIERQQYEQEQIRSSRAKSPLQHQVSSSLNRMPSATEVVRSALSRSGSQVSLNQLNKTIDLLPSSPPPYAHSTTPTQQLKPATPSLSPSPLAPNNWKSQQDDACRRPAAYESYSSQTLGHPHQHQRQQQQPTIQTTIGNGQVVLHGTRTVGRPPQQPHQQQPQQQKQQQQPVYTSPHASLMQHRQEQQLRQPNRNTASIREFNELDNLLRSLSPGASGGTYRAPSGASIASNLPPATQPARPPASQASNVCTQITPGYSSKSAQPSFGGYMAQKQQQTNLTSDGDLYAKVQRNQYNQQPFTIDVTNKKNSQLLDENCSLKQTASECGPELLPTMEDYQNISKLNPVTNRFWYKPNMSRDQAINLLKDRPAGTFIVRDSTSFRGAYGLAMKVSKLPRNVLESINTRSHNYDPSAEYIRHFLIEPVGSGSVRLKGYANEPVFDNLADLIYQHSLTELALPCKLVIPRADIEDPNFNQKQQQFFNEFLASKEQARHQPYEHTSPNGGYRRYPGDVLVHNEHRIIFE